LEKRRRKVYIGANGLVVGIMPDLEVWMSESFFTANAAGRIEA
jgi:hypothetical protein